MSFDEENEEIPSLDDDFESRVQALFFSLYNPNLEMPSFPGFTDLQEHDEDDDYPDFASGLAHQKLLEDMDIDAEAIEKSTKTFDEKWDGYNQELTSPQNHEPIQYVPIDYANKARTKELRRIEEERRRNANKRLQMASQMRKDKDRIRRKKEMKKKQEEIEEYRAERRNYFQTRLENLPDEEKKRLETVRNEFAETKKYRKTPPSSPTKDDDKRRKQEELRKIEEQSIKLKQQYLKKKEQGLIGTNVDLAEKRGNNPRDDWIKSGFHK